jgi:hypothetical protein
MRNRIPREKTVFVEALEIADPEQRRQFLDQACGADKALRAQVERLLALSQTAGDFFKDCAPALEPTAADAALAVSAVESAVEPEVPETKRIGPYKLLQKLGEGGYGVVYMAEQEQPIRRRVALKIIKLGMDSMVLRNPPQPGQNLASTPKEIRFLSNARVEGLATPSSPLRPALNS